MKKIINLLKSFFSGKHREYKWQEELHFAEHQVQVIEKELDSYGKLQKPAPSSLREAFQRNLGLLEYYQQQKKILSKKLRIN